MHVALRLVGQLEVDHVGNPRDVDPARCDIRCDEYPFLPCLKPSRALRRALWVLLPWIALASMPAALRPGHAISAVLGAGKDNGLHASSRVRSWRRSSGFASPFTG